MQNLSHEMAMQIIDHLDPVAVFDQNGKYIYVNSLWMDFLGFTKETVHELSNKRAWDIVPTSHVKEVIAKKEPLLGEFIENNGKKSFVSYFPLFKDGEFVGVVMWTMFSSMDHIEKTSAMIKMLGEDLQKARADIKRLSNSSKELAGMVGKSDAINQLKEEIIRASRTSSTVMIDGESGTGKELVARAIHDLSSSQVKGRFVPINCSAIPENLAESELFGYEDGAFTGAKKGGKPGKFELANHGTLFLDEIHQLSYTLQPKLLRVLQEHEIERVGGDNLIPVNFRCITATNTSLEQLAKSGDFREDLFYRLNVIRISVPPLRERKEDIPLLVDALISRLNLRLGLDVVMVNDAALERLIAYSWPGNIRELQNVIEAAMNRAWGGIIEEEHIQINRYDSIEPAASSQSADHARSFKDAQCELEAKAMQTALEENRGNKSKAAIELGMSRSYFYKKMKEYGLDQ